jgi:phosphoribosylformylglycinamidine synthase
MDLKRPGSTLAVVSAPADRVGLQAANCLHQALSDWIAEGHALSVHDVSDGGLAVALAEMCIAGNLGANVSLDAWGADDPHDLLFDEPLTTYVIECEANALDRLAVPEEAIAVIGQVTETPLMTIEAGGRSLARLSVGDLDRAWRSFGGATWRG